MCCAAATSLAAAGPQEAVQLEVTVHDSANLAVTGARVDVLAGEQAQHAQTNIEGRAVFNGLKSLVYTVVVTKEGFQVQRRNGVDLTSQAAGRVEVTLAALEVHRDTVQVEATAPPVEQGSSAPDTVSGNVARDMPGRPRTVADALPMLPAVVRRPDGGLQISAAAEHRSAMIVNSADVTDPATGQFGLTVPIDIVDEMNVYQTPFLAEYGKFTAGLITVATRRGGEKWKWELNDPLPEFIIRSWRMEGLRSATPRINVEGAIIPGKLYFSEGLEYEVRKVEVITLPFPNDQKKREGVNSFAQFDWVPTSWNTVTATVHVAPQRLSYVTMDAFDPQPTTPLAATHNYTATITDHASLLGGLLENTFSDTRFGAQVWGQGTDPMTIAPSGRSGDYFAQQHTDASRFSWAPSYLLKSVEFLGTHSFKVGAYLAQSHDSGQVMDQPIDIRNAQNQLTEEITFTPGHPFSLDDTEYAFFLQDHWSISPHLAADLGIRTESQEVSQNFRMAPRAGLAWSPFEHLGTVVRMGFGFFYDHVPLNVYSFAQIPKAIETFYDPEGNVTAGPYFFGNTLDVVNLRIPFVFRTAGPGNFSPQSATGSIQIEQPITRYLRLRTSYIHNQSAGLVVMNVIPPDPVTLQGARELIGSGQARYRQFEVTSRLRLSDKRQMFFSYVHSYARGDLNDFNNYLGSFPVPLVRPNFNTILPGDLPNRFLAWGTMQLTRSVRLMPVVEYRTGFPYSNLDAAQNYVGSPNSNRFPNFFALDARASKDIKVNPKYSVRLSVSGFNLTNHFNPEAIHNNIADPAFAIFFGERHRRFTVDFDVLF
jgi:hypothetical protein